ncbi:MAG: FxsA family protein [Beijerinckiaceae bacterium]|nr:FxsA family protein [Beijerinckiaceae bacterium]MCZ8300490.1 FxsA family protein [Beijerinckiaceae bacterium]
MLRSSFPALRPLLILVAGWMLLEFVLLELLAARLGWGLVLALVSLKGGLGLIALVLITLLAGRAARGRQGLDRLAALSFPMASGILIALPGLIPMLFGIALFSPSLRKGVVAWWQRRSGGAEDPRFLELPATEWKEIGAKKTRRKAKSVKRPLEGQPPSV